MFPTHHRALFAAMAALLLQAALTLPAAAQCEPQWQAGEPVVNPVGQVNATSVWDPDGAGPLTSVLVAGGDFTVGTMVSTAIATFDGTQWSPLGTLPAGMVVNLANYNGQLVAAIGAGGAPASITMWNGTSWQLLGSIGSNANGMAIRAMTVFQGALVVAGLFHSIGGVAVNNIASWNGTSWSALGTGVSGEARAMAVFSNVLYVGGNLTAAGGIPVGNLAIWNGSGWVATPPLNGPVNTLATRIGQTLLGSFLFAGGDFWIIGAVTAHSVARYSPSTNAWTAMGTSLNGISCKALFVRSTGISSYEVVAGVGAWPQVRRWDGTTWQQLGSLASGPPPITLTHFGGRYVLALPSSPTLVKLEANVWLPVSGPGFSGRAFALLDLGSDVILGGWLPSIAGVPMNGIARRTSNAWFPLGTGVTGATGSVYALARLPNGDVVAGGAFSTASGGAGDYIARWNGSTWSPLGSGLSGVVRALLAMPNGDVIAGGAFTIAGGGVATYIARWNGSVWAPLAGGMNGEVHALARLQNGDVVAGGDFTLAGSVVGVANRVARWNGSAWAPLGSGFDDRVRALAVMPNGELMAGGTFQFAGGWAPNVARWNGSWWAATAIGQQMFEVSSLSALPNGDLVAGGRPLLRMTGNTFTTLPVDGLTVDAVLTTRSGDLVVVGDFWTAGGLASANFARLVPPCAATAVAYGAGCSGSAGPLMFAATNLPWIGGTYRATATGIAPGALAFDLLGLFAASTPLSLLHPAGGAGCSMLVTAIATQLLLPSSGSVTTQIVLPNNPAFIGVILLDQVLQIELGASSSITALNSSNGLRLTVGGL